jgi:hypothetical protein
VALCVVLNTGAGFAIVGDSVTADAREELPRHGATVLANGGVDIVRGRPAIRRLSQQRRGRVVIELGLMDVAFWSSQADLRRRVRNVLRDDIGGIGCVIWLDLPTAVNQPYWRPRAEQFNAILYQLADQYGIHVARWSWYAARHRDWFRPDGVHTNHRGQRGYAAYVAGRVDHYC